MPARRLPLVERSPASRATRCGIAVATLLVAAVAFTGCASTSKSPAWGRDGPLPNPPADLDRVPDAEPKLETIRPGGANKPYAIDGRSYVPLPADAPLRERGLASWYGRKFQGRPTAIGEPYDMYAMSAAHPTLPLPSYARVRNPANGREVIVRVNDRGPFHPGRVIDLSYTAALKLGLLRGVGIVEVERITSDQIIAGTWRRNRDGTAVAVATPAVEAAPPPAAALPAPPAAPTLPQAAASPPPGYAAVAATATPAEADAAISEPSAAAPPSAAPPMPSATPSATAATTAAADGSGYWVQLGVFRRRDGATSFQSQVAADLAWIAPLLAVFDDAPLHRLQAGPYASREEAAVAAVRLRDALKLVPVIVERR